MPNTWLLFLPFISFRGFLFSKSAPLLCTPIWETLKCSLGARCKTQQNTSRATCGQPKSRVLLCGFLDTVSPPPQRLTCSHSMPTTKACLTSATVASGSVGNLAKISFLFLGQRALPRCGSSGLASDQMTMLPQAHTTPP